MSIDICGYIEFYNSELARNLYNNAGSDIVSSFTNSGKIFFPRDYSLFSIIKDVGHAGLPTAPYLSYSVMSEYEKNNNNNNAVNPTWLTLFNMKTVRKKYIAEKMVFNGVHDSNAWELLAQLDSEELSSSSSQIHDQNFIFNNCDSAPWYSSIKLMESLEYFDPNIVSRFVCWFEKR